MRELANDEREKCTLAMQIGNAFYLSDAYDIASQVYEEILESNLDGIAYDRILCQLVQAAIKLNNLAAAEQYLLNFRQTHNLLTEYRWHAELLYANALVHSGYAIQAMDYLSLLCLHFKHSPILSGKILFVASTFHVFKAELSAGSYFGTAYL
jgi:hypothetical protein